MKTVVWGVLVLAALFWTGGAALLAQLVHWSAQSLAAGDGTSIGAMVATASMPQWLGPWIDAASWTAAQEAVGNALAGLSGALPAIGDAVAWLVPAVWVIWGLGLLALIALGLLTTWLVVRYGRRFGAEP